MAVMTPMKAIRKHCVECSGGQTKEVELCPVTHCNLYPYRFGKRPSTIEKKKGGETDSK